MAALIPLVADIKERHGIGRGNVVGHSDIAPARKEDPGELFPWHALAKRRLALPSPTRDLIDPYWTDAGFLLALERFGYDVTDAQKAVIAFQRRFRPTSSTASSTANAAPSCSPAAAAAAVSCRPARCNRGSISRRPEGRAAAARASRGEESPGSTEQRCRVTPGGAGFGDGGQGQCHRKHTARLRAGKVERVRQERTAGLATGPAR